MGEIVGKNQISFAVLWIVLASLTEIIPEFATIIIFTLCYFFIFLSFFSFLFPNYEIEFYLLLGVLGCFFLLTLILVSLTINLLFVFSLLGIIWMILQSVILVDITHYLHLYIITKAHNNKDEGLLSKWYILHYSISLISLFMIYIFINMISKDSFTIIDVLLTTSIIGMFIISLHSQVNKGLLIPSILGFYISNLILFNTYTDNYTIRFMQFLITIITVVFGIVYKKSATLWYFLDNIIAPRCISLHTQYSSQKHGTCTIGNRLFEIDLEGGDRREVLALIDKNPSNDNDDNDIKGLPRTSIPRCMYFGLLTLASASLCLIQNINNASLWITISSGTSEMVILFLYYASMYNSYTYSSLENDI